MIKKVFKYVPVGSVILIFIIIAYHNLNARGKDI